MINVENLKKIESSLRIECIEKYMCLKAIIDKGNNDVLEISQK